ncbi:MAG TPA: PP2C family serine/threonine-protein phosphatase [Segetibacter sp.]
MADAKKFIKDLFACSNISVSKSQDVLLNEFIKRIQNADAINRIAENQNLLINNWKMDSRIDEIIQQPVRILNATTGKPYETKFDFDKLKWKDVTSFQFEGLEEVGLAYDEKTKQLVGIPTQSGDFKFVFKFKLAGEAEETPFHEKSIPLIINPDPKSLWKNLESDRNDPYWKEDDITLFAPLNDRHILVSSQRGRAHANVGSFREDDFAFKNLDNGWSVVVVADGAGSAKISRKGSAIACNEVVNFFTENSASENMAEFDELLQQHKNSSGEDTQKKLNHYVYNKLGKAAFHVHKKLAEFATQAAVPIKDLNSTLIFTLFKKYDIGYAFLSFGVGDCPIAILNKDVSEVTLMNWIDVGEFGGGTRFITMAEIFQNEKFATRFGFKLVDDFSYLMMMSDGIYDPKFVVEANLPNIKKWKEFLADLNGKNDEGVKVEFNVGNPEIVKQFSAWMDFWSPGNHDDRTLAIVF